MRVAQATTTHTAADTASPASTAACRSMTITRHGWYPGVRISIFKGSSPGHILRITRNQPAAATDA